MNWSSSKFGFRLFLVLLHVFLTFKVVFKKLMIDFFSVF